MTEFNQFGSRGRMPIAVSLLIAAGVIVLIVLYVVFDRRSVQPIGTNPEPAADGQQSIEQHQQSAGSATQPAGSAATQTMPNNMKIETVAPGTGAAAKDGDALTVQYTGMLADGTKFDSSYDHGQPFTFTLGAGRVIRGWDLGLVGMKVGEKRRLTIPPELGYGAAGTPGGPIPPNATLIFDVELVNIQ